MILSVRDIQESFWKNGKIPITRTIRPHSEHKGDILYVAQCLEIPVELMPEHSVEYIQAWADTTPIIKENWLDLGIPA